MVHKIIFQRSWIYDQRLQALRRKNFVMPTDKKINNKIKQLEKLWATFGNSILKEMTKITKLSWHQKTTTCYVTAGIVPFSDPLTVSIEEDVLLMAHILTHEMIHRLLTENWNINANNWLRLDKKYGQAPGVDRFHITVYAIHEHILRKLFNEKELNKEKTSIKDAIHLKTWKTVEKAGYQKIIADLTKGL